MSSAGFGPGGRSSPRDLALHRFKEYAYARAENKSTSANATETCAELRRESEDNFMSEMRTNRSTSAGAYTFLEAHLRATQSDFLVSSQNVGDDHPGRVPMTSARKVRSRT